MVKNKGKIKDTAGLKNPDWILNEDFIEKIINLIDVPAKLREEMESVNDGLVILNGDHAVFEANSKFSNMLGYSHAEIKKLHVWDWEANLTPEEIKQTSIPIQNFHVQFESEQKRKDGSLISVEINGKTFERNDQIWQLCICRNLGEQKGIESDLQKSQHNLYETQRIAHIGSWELDLETDIFLFSDEMARIWDIQDDEEKDIQKIMQNRIHPDDSEKMKHAFQNSIKQGLPYDIEYRIMDNQGNVKHLHSRSRITKNSQGKPVHVYSICQDITDQKKRNEERLLNEIRLLQSQEIAHIGTYEYNLKTHELWWSDELYRIHGIENNNDLNPGRYLDYIHPDDYERVIANQNLEREDYHMEYRIIRPDGEIRYISTFVGKHEYRDGERYLIRGTGQDITDQKLMEEEKKQLELKLHHAQKMETIGTLAGGVAHDINNILGIIIGNTELCLDDVPEYNPAYSNLQEIVQAVLRAKDVIRQLLTFSRNIDSKKETINIVSVVNESLRFLRSTISSSIEIEKQINITNPNIIADRTQINQIIMNICANSAQAMEATGGLIKVKLENIPVSHSLVNDKDILANGEYIKIIISDNGPGIPHMIHDKIFDPYFTTKEVGKGSGMGLAVVEGIVKKHKGAINVKSDVGEGATFTILLPGINEEKDEKPDAEVSIPPGAKRILFIDDEVQITKIAARMLESLGYMVDSKTNPQEALESFEDKPEEYDLVITDMAMPHMNALMLYDEIRRIRTDLPVLLSSGHNPLIDEKTAEEKGFSAYILKPFTKAELAAAIKNVFEKKA